MYDIRIGEAPGADSRYFGKHGAHRKFLAMFQNGDGLTDSIQIRTRGDNF